MAQYCFARTLYSMHFMAIYLQAMFLPTSDLFSFDITYENDSSKA